MAASGNGSFGGGGTIALVAVAAFAIAFVFVIITSFPVKTGGRGSTGVQRGSVRTGVGEVDPTDSDINAVAEHESAASDNRDPDQNRTSGNDQRDPETRNGAPTPEGTDAAENDASDADNGASADADVNVRETDADERPWTELVDLALTPRHRGPTADMNVLVDDLNEMQLWALRHGERLDGEYVDKLEYAGMALVDAAIATLQRDHLDATQYSNALKNLVELPGDRGAEYVLDFLRHTDADVRRLAWRYFETKRVVRFANELATRMPDLDAYAEQWSALTRAPSGQDGPPEFLVSVSEAGNAVLMTRESALAVAARNPGRLMMHWLRELGLTDSRHGGANAAYPADIAATLKFLSGVWVEALQPWAQVERKLFADQHTKNRAEGLQHSGRDIEAPQPDDRLAAEIEALREELVERCGRFSRRSDIERLRACGLAAVPMCLATLEQFPIDRRRPRKARGDERHDLRFLLELRDPVLAETFANVGFESMLVVASRERDEYDLSEAYARAIEFFSVMGASEDEMVGPHPIGFRFVRKLCEWLLVAGDRWPVEPADVYAAAKALDHREFVPWLLAVAEKEVAAAEEAGEVYRDGAFGRAMASLTRHVFTPLERNDHPAVWHAWLEAGER